MNLSSQLAEEKQAAAKEQASLAAVQRELFAVEQDVAAAQARNQQLERDLRARRNGTMTQTAKYLILVNLVLSVVFVAWAVGLLTNRGAVAHAAGRRWAEGRGHGRPAAESDQATGHGPVNRPTRPGATLTSIYRAPKSIGPTPRNTTPTCSTASATATWPTSNRRCSSWLSTGRTWTSASERPAADHDRRLRRFVAGRLPRQDSEDDRGNPVATG